MNRLSNVSSSKPMKIWSESTKDVELGAFQDINQNKMPNYFTTSKDRKNNYSQNAFKLYRTDMKEESSYNCKQGMSRSNYDLSNCQNRKPLHEILKSKQENTLKSLSEYQKYKFRQDLYESVKKRTKVKNDKVQIGGAVKDSQSKNRKYKKESSFEYIKQINNSPTLSRIRDSVEHVKTLQSQKKQQQQKSRSSNKKGLQCTLYQRALEIEVNQSSVSSNNKLMRVKARFEKTQNLGMDEIPRKDLKRVLIRKKNYQSPFLNSTICFRNTTKKRSKSKKSINKKCQAFLELNKSPSLTGKVMRGKGGKGSRSKSKADSKKSQSDKIQAEGFSCSTFPYQSLALANKKVTMNCRIQHNLDQIHQKYKFILNYLTDFDIIVKLNGFQLAGHQQCKWILLTIDDVYDLIKKSEKTKLKKVGHSRDYQFTYIHDFSRIP